MGDPTKWTEIYDANQAAIEEAARSHGHASSDHGRLVYPGTKLSITGHECPAPAAGTKLSVTKRVLTQEVTSGVTEVSVIEVRNIGSETATNVTVSDVTSEGVIPLGGPTGMTSSKGTCDPRIETDPTVSPFEPRRPLTPNCTIDSLAPGESVVIKHEAQAGQLPQELLHSGELAGNTATAEASNASAVQAKASFRIVQPKNSLSAEELKMFQQEAADCAENFVDPLLALVKNALLDIAQAEVTPAEAPERLRHLRDKLIETVGKSAIEKTGKTGKALVKSIDVAQTVGDCPAFFNMTFSIPER